MTIVDSQPTPTALLLVPTAMERDRLDAAMNRQCDSGELSVPMTPVEICGFGIAASAALTMHHLHTHRPRHVVLAGIAGSLHQECQVGSAYWYSGVLCDGIGVGEGKSFQAAGSMGWEQVGTRPHGIGDQIGLHVPSDRSNPAQHGFWLVTACAASADAEMARLRQVRGTEMLAQPGDVSRSFVAAEDMEGFAVALACQLMNVPLSIIRGISNEAGDRDHRRWKIDAAIEAVASALLKIL